jgi:hypothetical protein
MTTRRLGVILLVVAGLVGGGCSSGSAAEDWAGQVCTALAPWKAAIADLNSRGGQQMTGATSVAQTRESLDGLLAGAESATETARAKVQAAGVPDVHGGAAVAASFVTSLTGVRDAYTRAKADLMALPAADDKAFYDGVVLIMATLNEEYNRSAVDLDGLNSPELKSAFESTPACR